MLLGDIIALNVLREPERLVLVDGDGRSPSAELTTGPAARQRLLGSPTPGDRVAILSENIPEYVECYYGVPPRAWR